MIQLPEGTRRISLQKKSRIQPHKRKAAVLIRWRVLWTRRMWSLFLPLRSESFVTLPNLFNLKTLSNLFVPLSD
jgi:hypothetical protein